MSKLNIHHHVTAIKQPTLTECWATAVAMVLGFSPEDGVAKVKAMARSGGVNPAGDGGLDPHMVPMFARAVHLNCHEVLKIPQTPQAFAQLLRHGPAAATGMFYSVRSVSGLHVVTLYAMKGAGTPGGTEIYFVDPGTGHRGHDNFKKFVERDAAIDYILSRD